MFTMARSRLELQTILEGILGSSKVYFQRPPKDEMEYPCIVYSRDNVSLQFADNLPYRDAKRYQVTVIDRNPDSEIPDNVAQLQYCTLSRTFPANNLNHDVFTLYY